MRKFILIAGFALVSAAAQAGDRSLSLAGSETAPVAAPAKPAEAPKTAEAPQAAEAPPADAPKYIERPTVVEPKAESNTEAPKTASPKTQSAKTQSAKTQSARTQSANLEQPAAERARPAARRTASSSRSEKPRRKHYWTEARIVRELHRHGIYW
jgi:outer membrane biosynthesis protein TonB